MKKTTLTILLIVMLANTIAATGIDNSTMVQSLKAKVTVKGEGTISGDMQGTPVEIQVLSFKDTEHQKVLSLKETLKINGKPLKAKAETDDWQNRYASFEVRETGYFSYEIEAEIETNSEMPNLKEAQLENGITENREFLQPTKNIQSNDEAIRTLAFNRFPEEEFLEALTSITEWTNENLEYDLSYYPGTYPSLTVLEEKKGVCDEYAVLAAALMRAKGMPTRIITGLTYNPEHEKGWDSHAWIEAYSPSNGWLPADPTFGEAGTVDGTHIERGSFPDPADSSVSRVRAVSTAIVQIEQTGMEVNVETAKKFEGTFSITAEDIVMPANKWQSLNASAKNNLDRKAIGWFVLALPKEFNSEQPTRKLAIFEPGEEKQLEWNIRIDTKLKQGSQLAGNYRIITLNEEKENAIKVLPNPKETEEALVKVIEVTPIAKDGMLTAEVKIENLGSEPANVRISLDEETREITVPGRSEMTVQFTATGSQSQEHELSLTGPGLDYSATIVIMEGQPFIHPTEKNTNLINTMTNSLNSIAGQIGGLLFTLEAGLFAGAMIFFAMIALLLKALLSK